MQNKTALIVDDSRTASQMLRLMLEREEFQVDTRGSAEEALVYLQDHRPGIIFMDHLMPGMDGFEAVKEIKGNAVTAAIPIVMYTAKSGDLYVGQVQALGAIDILAKPPTRDALRAIFRRMEARSGASVPAESVPASVPPAVPTLQAVAEAAEAVAPPDETPADTEAPPVAPAPFVTADAADGGERDGARVSPWYVLAAAVAGFVLGMQYFGKGDDSAWRNALAWAASEGLQYPHGEAPFAGERLERIKGLVERLHAAGFRGSVRLEGHAGAFCIVARDGGWRLPDPGQPIEACEMIGVSAVEARRNSAMQSPDFRQYLQSAPELADGSLRVEVVPAGDRAPRVPYPPQDKVASAGDWNRIAARNNRIDVSLIPGN